MVSKLKRSTQLSIYLLSVDEKDCMQGGGLHGRKKIHILSIFILIQINRLSFPTIH
jgi:hypothetical protein